MIILESFISMFWDIAPIIGMILIFQLFIIKEKIPNLAQTLFGIFIGLDRTSFIYCWTGKSTISNRENDGHPINFARFSW